MNAPRIAAIILAAGASRRLGQPKQLVQLGPETLLERTVRITREAACDPTLVVLGADADLIQSRSNLTGAHIVTNRRWPEGMATSIRAALEALFSFAPAGNLSFRPERSGAEEPASAPAQAQDPNQKLGSSPISGAILMVCDQPAVTPAHLRSLTATGQLTASEYAGRRGVPAYFPADLFPQLAQLTGDSGARDLLRTAPTIALPQGELDIDTPAALETARVLYGE